MPCITAIGEHQKRTRALFRRKRSGNSSGWAVRTIGLSSDDLLPSGLPVKQHLAVISRLKTELAELEESKADLEERRLKLLAAARRLGVMDDYELVALSGLQRETIRKMTWGVRPESVV